MRKIGFALASLLLPVLVLGGAAWPGGGALAATGDTLIVTGDGVNVRYGPSPGAKVRMQIYRGQLVSELQREGDWVQAEIAGTDGASGWIHASLLAEPSAEQLSRARERASRPPSAGLPEVKPSAPPPANPAAAAPAPPVLAPAPVKPKTSDASPSAPPAAAASSAGPPADASSTPPAPVAGAAVVAPAPDTPEADAVEPATGPADAADATGLARFRESVDYLNSRSATVAGVDLFDGVEAASEGVVQVGATDAWSSIPPASQQSYANTLLDRWAAARGYSGPVTVQIVDPDGKVLLESKKP